MYSIITNKDVSTKENTRTKQVLKNNGYQQSITCKIFNRMASSQGLSQPQQETQATYIQEEDIRISINLP